jgi:hypothetical protein
LLKDLNQTWDLDVFFPGGSSSPELKSYLDKLEADLESLRQRLSGNAPLGIPQWKALSTLCRMQLPG